MKIKKIKVPLYGWTVKLVEVERNDKFSKLKKHLKFAKDLEFYETLTKNIKDGLVDGGAHFYNPNIRRSLIVLYIQSSLSNRLEIIGHEKRHVEDRIIEYCGLEGPEAAAYVAGYLTKKLI